MGGLTHGRELDIFPSTKATLGFVSKFTQQVSSNACVSFRLSTKETTNAHTTSVRKAKHFVSRRRCRLEDNTKTAKPYRSVL